MIYPWQSLLLQPSKIHRDHIVSSIGDDEKAFGHLFHLYETGSPTTMKTAIWAISSIVDIYPHLILPYLDELLTALTSPNPPVALKRNILRIYQEIEIPKKQEGQLMDISFRSLIDKKEPVAIRVFSMQILANLSKEYPEIERELGLIITDELPYAKPAFVSRGRKILKQLAHRTT